MNKRSTFNFAVAAVCDRRNPRHEPEIGAHTAPLQDQSGVALILTLAVLALVTLLLIAFVASMRVENAASKNFNDMIKARELAQGAIDQAVAQIRQATPSRALVGGVFQTNYVTYPGGAYVYNSSGALTAYSLFSGPTSTDQTNLNSGLWITGGTSVGPGEFYPTNNAIANQINVGWLYVDQNGNVGPPPLSQPLVGRIAYWVDDEASKINVNTAGVPACTDPLGACSTSNDVDLTQLLPNSSFTTYANSIQTAAATQPFTTIEEIKRANPAITNAFDDNRFEVTAYSNDANYPNYNDDLDVFDRPRMVLNPATLNGNFNAAVTELSDPNLATLYGSGASATPKAFQSKYDADGPNGANGLKQLIANIIGYQIDPTATAPPTDGNATTAPTYLGLTKSPVIAQIQVEYDVTAAPPTVQRIVTVTLLYLYGGRYNSTGEQIAITGLPQIGSPLLFPTTATITILPGTTLNQNAPVAFTHTDTPVTFTGNPLPLAATPSIFYTRGYLLDYAQPVLIRNVTFSSGGGSFYQGAVVVDDPAVHESEPGDWKSYTALPVPTSSYPTGDVSKVAMRGAPMLSVGELGYIHLPGVAYGHLKLQPGGGSTAGKIPDWALLDLFTVGQGTAGRININSWINPSLAGNPTPAAPRLVPLKALLSGAGISSPGAIAQNIYNDQFTDRGTVDSYGMANGRYGIFDTIGEVCEIPSLANGATTQAGLEATIRRIANLITVRSNTFTIWVMAQSIKQPPGSTFGTYNPPPTGPDLITGEVRAQAVVERYENPPGSAPKFRLRYIRYL